MYYLNYEKKILQRKLDSLFNKINHVLENISCLFLEYIVFFEGGMGHLSILIWLKVNQFII